MYNKLEILREFFECYISRHFVCGALFRGETFGNAFSSLVSKVQNRVFINPPLNMILGDFDPFDIIVRYLFVIWCRLMLPHHLI